MECRIQCCTHTQTHTKSFNNSLKLPVQQIGSRRGSFVSKSQDKSRMVQLRFETPVLQLLDASPRIPVPQILHHPKI